VKILLLLLLRFSSGDDGREREREGLGFYDREESSDELEGQRKWLSHFIHHMYTSWM
jgi:hypothetical protein